MLPQLVRPDAAPTAPAVETRYRPRARLDLLRTVLVHQRGRNDPTMRVEGATVWRAVRTPEGVAALALRQAADGTVHASAWGAGAAWAVDQVPALCGRDDDERGFDPTLHPLVEAAHRRHPGLRLSRSDLPFHALAVAIFEQKITGMQAFAAWRRIVTAHGTAAPGPAPTGMFAPPAIEDWARVPSWSWHRAGLEPPQARTLVRTAARGRSIVRALSAAGDAAAQDRLLRGLPGIGVWTSAETRLRAFGDPDAVSFGDIHLSHTVGHALTGARTDDDGMARLLAPWAGHRQRVIRLIHAAGVLEPRRGPRLHPEDHRRR